MTSGNFTDDGLCTRTPQTEVIEVAEDRVIEPSWSECLDQENQKRKCAKRSLRQLHGIQRQRLRRRRHTKAQRRPSWKQQQPRARTFLLNREQFRKATVWTATEMRKLPRSQGRRSSVREANGPVNTWPPPTVPEPGHLFFGQRGKGPM